jgi:hypothetical protein
METNAGVIEGLPHWLQVVLTVLGLVVPIASVVAGFVNAYVRTAKSRGEFVPTWLLAIATGVNIPALNVDKSIEAVKTVQTQATGLVAISGVAAPEDIKKLE